jgi:hypothetical protein
VLRGVRVTLPLIAVALVVEIAVRALLIRDVGLFVAYQALPNWLTVFLLGLYYGQRAVGGAVAPGLPVTAGLLAAGAVWVFAVAAPEPYRFPFNVFSAGDPWADSAVTSAAVSLDYAVFTLLAFAVAARLPGNRVVDFFSRTTLFVFIVHMPVFYAMRPAVNDAVPSWAGRTAIFLLTGFVLMAVLGDIVNRVVPAKALRDRTWAWLTGRRPAGRADGGVPTPAGADASRAER